MYWNIYTTNAQISYYMFRHSMYAIIRESTVVKVVFSKWSVVCSTVAHLHTY